MDNLKDYGWTIELKQKWAELVMSGLRPARVVADFGTSLKVATPEVTKAELTGKLAHYSTADESPKIGDWVAVRVMSDGSAVIESVILRKNEIARKVAGKQTAKQIIAANIDVAFVLLALDADFSIERLQRFLFQLSVNDIKPVIVLNKADKTNDLDSYLIQLNQFELPVIITQATNGTGVEKLLEFIKPGSTAILLGSSGVGKSTLTNALLQREAQSTATVRESDSTGKHTTVHRELFVLPNGGLLVDTPGIRELALWGEEDQLHAVYADIFGLSERCRFAGCSHEKESGCAVKKALQNGKLDKKHYANYQKMQRELALLSKNHTSAGRKQNKRPRQHVDWTKED